MSALMLKNWTPFIGAISMNFCYSQRAFLDEINYLTKNCCGSLERIEETLEFYGFKCKWIYCDTHEEEGLIEVSKFGRKTTIRGFYH